MAGFEGDDRTLMQYLQGGARGKAPFPPKDISGNADLNEAIDKLIYARLNRIFGRLRDIGTDNLNSYSFGQAKREFNTADRLINKLKKYDHPLSQHSSEKFGEIQNIFKKYQKAYQSIEKENKIREDLITIDKQIAEEKKIELKKIRETNAAYRQRKAQLAQENKFSSTYSDLVRQSAKAFGHISPAEKRRQEKEAWKLHQSTTVPEPEDTLGQEIRAYEEEKERVIKSKERANRLISKIRRREAKNYYSEHNIRRKRELTLASEYFADAKNKHFSDALFGEKLMREHIAQAQRDLEEARKTNNPEIIRQASVHLRDLEEGYKEGTEMFKRRSPLYRVLSRTERGRRMLAGGQNFIEKYDLPIASLGLLKGMIGGINAATGLPQTMSHYYGGKLGQAKPYLSAELIANSLGGFGNYLGENLVGSARLQNSLQRSGMSFGDLRLLGGMVPQTKGGAVQFLRDIGRKHFGLDLPGFAGIPTGIIGNFERQARQLGAIHSFTGRPGLFNTISTLLTAGARNGLDRFQMLQQMSGVMGQYGTSIGTMRGFNSNVLPFLNNVMASNNPALRSVSGAYGNVSAVASATLGNMLSNPFDAVVGMPVIKQLTHNYDPKILHKMGLSRGAITRIEDAQKHGLFLPAAQIVSNFLRHSNPALLIRGTHEYLSKTAPKSFVSTYDLSVANSTGLGINTVSEIIDKSMVSSTLSNEPWLPGQNKNYKNNVNLANRIGTGKNLDFKAAQSAADGMLAVMSEFSGAMDTFSDTVVHIKEQLDKLVGAGMTRTSSSVNQNQVAHPAVGK